MIAKINGKVTGLAMTVMCDSVEIQEKRFGLTVTFYACDDARFPAPMHVEYCSNWEEALKLLKECFSE